MRWSGLFVRRWTSARRCWLVAFWDWLENGSYGKGMRTIKAAEIQPGNLNRIQGEAFGIDSAAWPRHQGTPMQPLYTLDLEQFRPTVPQTKGMRVMVVFVDSYLEAPVNTSDGYAIRWATQAPGGCKQATTGRLCARAQRNGTHAPQVL